ncbi:MAG: DUF2281 domain-containing protein [Bacteroidota bacterium]|nr:DUF2281 domain-containing protein [Bacteroidota bacterium]
MLTAIKGTYKNGHVILEEPAPTDKTVPVLVTFLEKEVQHLNLKLNRIIGSLEGKISIPDDFNEPLDDLKEYM